MKIMLMITGMQSGGAERVMATLANELVKKHTVYLVIMKSAKTDYYLSDKIVISAGKIDNQSLIKSVHFAANEIVNREPDVVLSFMTKTNIIALLAGMLTKTNTKIIIAERANPYNAQMILKFARRFLYPKASGAVFQTSQAQDYYKHILKCSSVVLRNPLNPDFQIKPYEGERRKTIVTMGRLSIEKNQKLLIDAFEMLADKFLDYSVEIYGEGPLHQNLQNHIDKLNLGSRVQLMGRKNDIQQHIRKAGIFVLPSNSEGMPNVLLEAMAMGIPSIATDCPIGGSAFIIQDHENGILIPMNDINALVKAMVELIQNPIFAEKLGRNGSKVSEDFKAEKVCAEWETYLKLVANRG